MEYRFNVFGTAVAVVGGAGSWNAYYLGADGKRRAADFQVPAEVAGDELGEYLGDLFHEYARPGQDTVKRLDHAGAATAVAPNREDEA